MRSNMFANVEHEFTLAAEEDIIATAIDALSKITSLDDKTRFGIAIVGARLGVSGDGMLNAKEKMLIDRVFGRFWKGSMEQIYESVGTAIGESDYELVKTMTQMGDAVAFQLLRYILSFAYIDGAFEDDIANKLDGLFGMPLMRIFFASVMENVPSPGRKLTELEAEIVKWFRSEDRLIPLEEIQAHFSQKPKTEVKAAVDSLYAKGILYGGERFILDLYGLSSCYMSGRW